MNLIKMPEDQPSAPPLPQHHRNGDLIGVDLPGAAEPAFSKDDGEIASIQTE